MSKTANTENFPVASLLLAKPVRQKVLDFYRLARRWDDIADDATLSSQEKLVKLPLEHANPFLNDLLVAFRKDAESLTYRTWQDLLEYCRFSANPVGRFLLEIHGETKGHAESDALCSALQILNHLQDCQQDYRSLGRIYLPYDFLNNNLDYKEELNRGHSSPALRKVLDQCLDHVDSLIAQAIYLPRMIKNRRLSYQAKVTLLCALALAGKLRRMDPLATRVELNRIDKFLLAYKGIYPL